MSKLPSLAGRQVVKALQKVGLTVIRQKGSYAFLRHPDGRSTVVPHMRVKPLVPACCARSSTM
jgi:predicted RNA binding protein YcfA (HicA-like mRNA interferase family)